MTGHEVSRKELSLTMLEAVALGAKTEAEYESSPFLTVLAHDCKSQAAIESIIAMLEGFDNVCKTALEGYYLSIPNIKADAESQAKILAANLHNIGTTSKGVVDSFRDIDTPPVEIITDETDGRAS